MMSKWRQNWNITGLKATLQYLGQPSFLRPSCIVSDVTKIDFEAIKKDGIQALCFDMDNTLAMPYACSLYPPFKEAWKRVMTLFESNLLIVSNSAGTKDDIDHRQAREIENNFHVPVLRHALKKPGCGKEILVHFQAYPPHQIMMIGDRLLTDILTANMHHMKSILVNDPISPADDPVSVQMIRKWERLLLSLYVRPSSHPEKQYLYATKKPSM